MFEDQIRLQIQNRYIYIHIYERLSFTDILTTTIVDVYLINIILSLQVVSLGNITTRFGSCMVTDRKIRSMSVNMINLNRLK